MLQRLGKYRLRTWLRGTLPGPLSDLFPRGTRDCGAHEWYRSDESTWRCYHCEVGLTHESPWSPLEDAELSLSALRSLQESESRRGLSAPEEELRVRLARDLLAAVQRLTGEGRSIVARPDEPVSPKHSS